VQDDRCSRDGEEDPRERVSVHDHLVVVKVAEGAVVRGSEAATVPVRGVPRAGGGSVYQRGIHLSQ
jgi:hypothetical protein